MYFQGDKAPQVEEIKINFSKKVVGFLLEAVEIFVDSNLGKIKEPVLPKRRKVIKGRTSNKRGKI